jgi:regulator of protease activity HflC (stomatin/prohibitin superfamily)
MRARGFAIALLALVVGTGCVRIDAGHRGVLFKWLGGTDMDQSFAEGVHIIAPWNRMIPYDLRLQDSLESVEVLTSNGLSVRIDVSVRFRPDANQLPFLHQELGREYYKKIVQPIVRSEVRRVVGGYTPEEIYSTKRPEVGSKIFESIKREIEVKPLLVDAVLIRNVGLPDQLRKAISEKLEEEQRALKMKYVLIREEQEANRKRIEAQGIADFQKIVSAGISANLLRWKGIEATQALAESTNSKVVVIGSGKDGLPLILGGAQ